MIIGLQDATDRLHRMVSRLEAPAFDLAYGLLLGPRGTYISIYLSIYLSICIYIYIYTHMACVIIIARYNMYM